jgi:hypothetical protein
MAQPEVPGHGFPEKPDHPDMDRLSAVIAEYLTPLSDETANEHLQNSLKLLVDGKAVSWVAMQRTLGFLEISTMAEVQERLPEVFRMSVFWLDGFIAGGHLERGRNEGDSGEDENI